MPATKKKLTIAKTIVYQYLFRESSNNSSYPNNIEVQVSSEDCISLAKQLCDLGKNPCLLNMANQFNVGGEYMSSTGGQEEYIIRRTNLLDSLQHIDGVKVGNPLTPFKYELEETLGFLDNKQKQGFGEFSCLFTENVTINENPTNYCINVLSSAAYNLNDLSNRPEYNFYVAGTIFKIINQLRVAKKHGQRNLILGAFGCGAFANDPTLISEIYHAAIKEPEFLGCFDCIYFSIKRSVVAEEINNFLIFQQEFAKKIPSRSIVTMLRNIYNQIQQETSSNLQLSTMVGDFFKIETIDDLVIHVNLLIEEELTKLDRQKQQAKISFVLKIQALIKENPSNVMQIIGNLKLLDGYTSIEYGQGMFRCVKYPFLVKLENILTAHQQILLDPDAYHTANVAATKSSCLSGHLTPALFPR